MTYVPRRTSQAAPKSQIVTIRHPDLGDRSLKGGYAVKYVGNPKRITLYRNLLAKLAYDPQGIFFEEAVALLDLALIMGSKSQTDPQFKEKFEKHLISANRLISELVMQTFPYHATTDWKQKTKEELKGFLPSSNAYFGWSRNPIRGGHVRVIFRNPLKLPPKLPPKKVIGVGYRDSGHRRDPAKDGMTYKDLMKAPPGAIEGASLPTQKPEVTVRAGGDGKFYYYLEGVPITRQQAVDYYNPKEKGE